MTFHNVMNNTNIVLQIVLYRLNISPYISYYTILGALIFCDHGKRMEFMESMVCNESMF